MRIQRIALEWPCYGRPRITAELRRQEWTVNPKRVYRLTRADNLLCVRQRKFVVTTDSKHGRRIYPNRARDLVLTDTTNHFALVTKGRVVRVRSISSVGGNSAIQLKRGRLRTFRVRLRWHEHRV